MRAVRDAGFEVGVHAWDHVKWQDGLGGADAEWTERQMRLARGRFEEIFGESARAHGAAGWQMNVHALRLTQRLGFDYCSDTRGSCPFIPVWRAEIVACPQLPTTLRSEEHTSELQSLAYLVCRLLLEKKKRKKGQPRAHPPST